ncbi:MAG: hypothetical protein AAF125_05140 [Chloroflexota bacterium]
MSNPRRLKATEIPRAVRLYLLVIGWLAVVGVGAALVMALAWGALWLIRWLTGAL